MMVLISFCSIPHGFANSRHSCKIRFHTSYNEQSPAFPSHECDQSACMKASHSIKCWHASITTLKGPTCQAFRHVYIAGPILPLLQTLRSSHGDCTIPAHSPIGLCSLSQHQCTSFHTRPPIPEVSNDVPSSIIVFSYTLANSISHLP